MEGGEAKSSGVKEIKFHSGAQVEFGFEPRVALIRSEPITDPPPGSMSSKAFKSMELSGMRVKSGCRTLDRRLEERSREVKRRPNTVRMGGRGPVKPQLLHEN